MPSRHHDCVTGDGNAIAACFELANLRAGQIPFQKPTMDLHTAHRGLRILPRAALAPTAHNATHPHNAMYMALYM